MSFNINLVMYLHLPDKLQANDVFQARLDAIKHSGVNQGEMDPVFQATFLNVLRSLIG